MKKLICGALLSLALLIPLPALAQGTTTIANLPAANPLNCTEVLPLWQGGFTRKVPACQLGIPYTGSVAPYALYTGQEWWNNTTNPLTLSLYDGSQWISLGSLNTSTHKFSYSPFTSISAVNLNAGTMTAPQTGALFQGQAADGVEGRFESDTFGAIATFTGVVYGGTRASPTAITSGTQLTGINAKAYNGSAIVGPIYSFRGYAAENIASGHQGSKACVATTPIASTALADALCINADGSAVLGSPTGGDECAFCLNTAGGIFDNGVRLRIGATVQGWSATLDSIVAGTWTGATSITTLGTVTAGTWNGSVVAGAYGGTGVANTGKTITVGASLATTGAGATTLAFGASTQTYTFPTASDTIPGLGTVNTWTGAQTYSANGSASVSPVLMSGTILTGGTATTNVPALFIQPSGTTAVTSWNTAGTGLGMNLASGFGGNFIDLHSGGGASVFKADSAGNVTITGDHIGSANGSRFMLRNGNTVLSSPGSAIWQLGAADAASPVAQTIGPQNVVAGTSNTAGSTFTINPSIGTGFGVGGNIVFNYAPHDTAHAVTTFTGSASPYTIGFTAGNITTYPVGTVMTVAGCSTATLNGSYTVTASSSGSVTATTSATGTGSPTSCTIVGATSQNVAVPALTLNGDTGTLTINGNAGIVQQNAVTNLFNGGFCIGGTTCSNSNSVLTRTSGISIEVSGTTGVGWAPSTNPTAAADTAFWRDSAGVVDVGNSSTANALGSMKMAALTLSSTLTTNVTGSTQCLQVNSSGVVSGTTCASPAVSTRQIFTSGSGATYTTPANVRQLRIRMVAGGGGGSGYNGSSVGGTGGTTSFNGVTAIGGSGGTTGGGASIGTGGAGGTGGSNGTAVSPFRTNGNPGFDGLPATATFAYASPGGVSCLGSTYGNGGVGGAGSGAGNGGGGAGGAGECVDFIINAPSPTMTFTVAAGGAASTGGSTNGAIGKPGIIIVDEYY